MGDARAHVCTCICVHWYRRKAVMHRFSYPEGVHCAISLDPGVFSRGGMRAPYLKAVRRFAIRYRSEVLGVTSSGLKSYSSSTQVR